METLFEIRIGVGPLAAVILGDRPVFADCPGRLVVSRNTWEGARDWRLVLAPVLPVEAHNYSVLAHGPNAVLHTAAHIEQVGIELLARIKGMHGPPFPIVPQHSAFISYGKTRRAFVFWSAPHGIQIGEHRRLLGKRFHVNRVDSPLTVFVLKDGGVIADRYNFVFAASMNTVEWNTVGGNSRGGGR